MKNPISERLKKIKPSATIAISSKAMEMRATSTINLAVHRISSKSWVVLMARCTQVAACSLSAKDRTTPSSS